jgi:hypothetical protein
MKLTKSRLKQIIKEELTKIVRRRGVEEAGWYDRDEKWFEKGVMGRKIATVRWYPDENKWKWDITIYRAAGPEDYYEEPAAPVERQIRKKEPNNSHTPHTTKPLDFLTLI